MMSTRCVLWVGTALLLASCGGEGEAIFRLSFFPDEVCLYPGKSQDVRIQVLGWSWYAGDVNLRLVDFYGPDQNSLDFPEDIMIDGDLDRLQVVASREAVEGVYRLTYQAQATDSEGDSHADFSELTVFVGDCD
jgi:hypothetical protein